MADTVQFPPTTPLAAAGEHCPACGAVLAADQRYCLNCGLRRADSRVPFPDALGGGAAGGPPAGGVALVPGAGPGGAGPVTAASAGPAPKAKRSWADRDLLLPVLGSSLLAIAVGILIGRSGASDTINTKAPVVNVAPTAGAATAAPATTTANASADTTAGTSTGDSASKDKTTTTTEKAAPPANVSKSVLEDNAKASGKDYVKKSQKLPTQVGTGGAPPATDTEPAGGGAAAETIG